MVKLERPIEFRDDRHLPSFLILTEIGRLAIISAGVEDILHAIYWKYANLPDEIGAFITKETKPSHLMEDIIKIGKINSASKSQLEDLKDIFVQYRILAEKRNKFVHWIWHPIGDSGNKIVPPSYKLGAIPQEISTDDLTKLADDMAWIEFRLCAHAMSEQEIIQEKKERGTDADLYVPTPWLDVDLKPKF